MDEFKDQSKNVVKHIPSKHQKEMEKKSEVVRQNTICQHCATFIFDCLSIDSSRSDASK